MDFDFDEGHIAHPRLYGAPAYARPPRTVTPTALPPHPDDLPLDFEQTEEERAVVARLANNPLGVPERPATHVPGPDRRPAGLGLIAGKLLGRAS